MGDRRDVLTFYQERIANEGYLRTATERRSVLELARLVGYQPRPGVASSVYLAYTLDDNFKEETIIPEGARSQSVPGPGELPQSFETSDDLKARAQWNNLKPRMMKPQNITFDTALRISKIYLEGTATNLKVNDPLLLVFGDLPGDQVVRLAQEVKPDFQNGRTEVTLQETPFLISTAVDLLRTIVARLDKELHPLKLAESAPDSDKTAIAWLDGVRNGVRTLLENLALDNYPPLHEAYFSHDRIHRFLRELSLMRRDQFVAVTDEIAGFTSVGDEAEGRWAFLRDARIVNIAKEVLDQVVITLENPSFRHDLVCLFRHLLQQTLPTTPAEREALTGLLGYIPQLDTLLKHLLKKREDSLEVLRVKVLVVLSDLASFLRDPDLRDHFISLLKELLTLSEGADFEKQHEFLNKVQIWLDSIPINTMVVKCGPTTHPTTSLTSLIGPLSLPPSIQPANNLRLPKQMAEMFTGNADTIPQLLTGFQPRLRDVLYQAWANALVETALPQLKSLHALRLTAPLFGNNAQVKMGLKTNEDPITKEAIKFVSVPDGDWDPKDTRDEKPDRLYLGNAYDTILPGSYLIIENNETGNVSLARADSVTMKPRTAYLISTKTTQIDLSREWWEVRNDIATLSMATLRKTLVHIETEGLSLAPEPDENDVAGDIIELQELYDGLTSGRWVIVSGERSDIPATTGVRAAELAMLSSVEQVFDEHLPGDQTHTKIRLANKLAYCFKRDTVTIYGNVVKATHGEMRKEVLGSGDGAKALQSFVLKQPPVTYVAASHPSGVDSTLKVYVNDVQWRETDSLAGLSPTDRNFFTKTDDEGKTTVVFGNGREGARLPTGVENIKAEYRNGIGKLGNVKAGQITLLTTRPLGVKEVVNPLRASGGASKESRDQARKNAPLAVQALDRLVAVQDYEDFARTYAGIGKARAVELSDGRRQVVHITIAGADDIPIDKHSDLFRNLRQALRDFGDPYQAIQLEIRELMLIVISARIRILPEYRWEPVVTHVRATLRDRFGFERRELGQDVLLSEVMSVMQGVRGVAYVDVDTVGGIPEKRSVAGERRLLTPEEISKEVQAMLALGPTHRIRVNLAGSANGSVQPAQLAFLTPEVPETLILNQII